MDDVHRDPGPQRRRLYRMAATAPPCELVRSGSSGHWLPPWLATYIANSRRLHTPSVSKVLRKWFLTTCSVVPMIFPISRLVRPCQGRNLNLLGGEALTWRHDACSSLAKTA